MNLTYMPVASCQLLLAFICMLLLNSAAISPGSISHLSFAAQVRGREWPMLVPSTKILTAPLPMGMGSNSTLLTAVSVLSSHCSLPMCFRSPIVLYWDSYFCRSGHAAQSPQL